MSQKSRSVLKEYFEAGKIPTEDQCSDLIDSSLNKLDDQVYVKTVGSGKGAKKRLGVGEANPDARLHVSGDLKLENGVTVNEIADEVTDEAENDGQALATVKALRELISEHLVGSIMPFARELVPPGWVECDGRTIDTNLEKDKKFRRLYEMISENFKNELGDGIFKLPDLRGLFVRGWDGSKAMEKEIESGNKDLKSHLGIDGDANERKSWNKGKKVGNKIGSYQDDAFQGHKHSGFHRTDGPYAARGGSRYNIFGYPHHLPDNHQTSDPVSDGRSHPRTAAETRPRNIALMYCIKF